MTERDLKRRISDALLAGGLSEEPDIDAALAEDAEAAAYARESEKIDGLLRGWPKPAKTDAAWESLASRIDQRLKDPLRSPGDMTLAPRFEDDDPFVREPRAAVAPARPGVTVAKPVAAPAARPVGAKPFVPSKPGGVLAPPAATHPKAEHAPPAASHAEAEHAPPGAEHPKAELAPPPPGAVPELAPPPPGVAPAAEAAAEAPDPTAPVTVSEPPELISLPPPSRASAPDSEEFSLSNLSNLDVKHQAPPPVPAAALAKHPHPAKPPPPPKDDRAVIPIARQPIAPLLAVPSFSQPPPAPEKKKASRAPLYGMLALAATVGLAFLGWQTLGPSGSRSVASAPDAVAVAPAQEAAPARDQAASGEAQAFGTVPAAPMQPAAMPAMGPGAQAGAPTDDGAHAADNGVAQATPTTPAPTVTVAVTGGGAAPGTMADGQGADTSEGHAAHHAHGAAHPPAGGAPAGGGGNGGATPPAPPDHHARPAGGAAHAAGGGGTNDAPPRDEVVRALGTVRAAVVTCAQGRGGVAWVQVTFAGPTGRVSNAVVQGNFAGTPQGSCIARAVRGAQVAPFRNATASVVFPFQL